MVGVGVGEGRWIYPPELTSSGSGTVVAFVVLQSGDEVLRQAPGLAQFAEQLPHQLLLLVVAH